MGQRPLNGLVDLAQVVRRNVGGHPDGDAGRPVDQQVREPGRQHGRFFLATVVVVLEIDGVLADIADHLHGQRRHLALGVPHGRCRVVARRTEVALTGHQPCTHHPRLRQAHQGVVNRRVTVRVVQTHDLADDTRALVPAAVGTVATVVHRVDHSAVHRFETVAHIGQRAPDDDAHRVLEIGVLHLGLQVDLLDQALARFGDLAVGLGRGIFGACRVASGAATLGVATEDVVVQGVVRLVGPVRALWGLCHLPVIPCQMSRKRTSLALR